VKYDFLALFCLVDCVAFFFEEKKRDGFAAVAHYFGLPWPMGTSGM